MCTIRIEGSHSGGPLLLYTGVAMAREFAKSFYASTAWKKCRKQYIDSVGGLCERCLARGVVKPGYILHHKIKLEPWNIDDQSVTLNPANLEYVCLDCHNADELGEHSGTGPKHKPRRARFDSAGRLLPPIKFLRGGRPDDRGPTSLLPSGAHKGGVVFWQSLLKINILSKRQQSIKKSLQICQKTA